MSKQVSSDGFTETLDGKMDELGLGDKINGVTGEKTATGEGNVRLAKASIDSVSSQEKPYLLAVQGGLVSELVSEANLGPVWTRTNEGTKLMTRAPQVAGNGIVGRTMHVAHAGREGEEIGQAGVRNPRIMKGRDPIHSPRSLVVPGLAESDSLPL
ncbi:hypothetical protein Dimus_035383 [Dionaea muscipula]